MALQLGLRRGTLRSWFQSPSSSSSSILSSSNYCFNNFHSTQRWKSTDVGDVIGIDLGTTNSCVAIMVRTM
eukprot:scaffold210414_cov23-Cyclotella_meneghiniana.AAC.3